LGVQRIGILGGTFNPIHLGHLFVAEQAQKAFDLARVLFVVSTVPPHKRTRQLAAFTHRYTMVALATARMRSFVPSLAELTPPASPFSVDTLAKISRAEKGKSDLYFIAGADSMLEISMWHRSERLLSRYNLIFVERPGFEIADPASVLPRAASARLVDLRQFGPRQMTNRIQEATRSGGSSIYLVDVNAPDISASTIRALAASGRSLQRLVPKPVRDYMKKFDLYGER